LPSERACAKVPAVKRAKLVYFAALGGALSLCALAATLTLALACNEWPCALFSFSRPDRGRWKRSGRVGNGCHDRLGPQGRMAVLAHGDRRRDGRHVLRGDRAPPGSALVVELPAIVVRSALGLAGDA